ncbi:Mitochondrial genome maintenance exonuclease 1 [Sergentomyia squamirostris]
MLNFPQNYLCLHGKMLKTVPRHLLLQHFRRKSNDSSEKRAEIIKNLYFETKALYGGVSRELSGNVTPRRTLAEKSDLSTEMFWVMGRRQERVTSVESLPEGRKVKLKKPSLPKSLMDLKKNLPPEPRTGFRETPRIAGNTVIPFDENTLRDLVDFPLIFNKQHPTGNCPESFPEGMKAPSVGKILQATMPEASREALKRWKILQIAELGEEGFKKLQEKHLTEGARLHRWIEGFSRTQEIPPEAEKDPTWSSVREFLQTIQPKIIESRIEHPLLKYQGIVDGVSLVNSELHVIEWKKSERSKPTLSATFDAPLQLAAYLGALNANLGAHGLTEPVKRGAVVVIYTDGRPADVHTLKLSDIQLFWRSWLLRLQEFWIRSRDGTLPEPI